MVSFTHTPQQDPLVKKILTLLAKPGACRAMTGTRAGARNRPCKPDARLVVIGCVHEHMYEVMLCEAHIAALPLDRGGCPLCRSAEDDTHICRHGLVRA